MDTELPIDVQSLLGPIEDSADRSVLESKFIRVKDAFDDTQALIKEQEDKERMKGLDATGQPWRVIPPPDWDHAIELATDYLKASRDLRVAAWLTGCLLGKFQLRGLDAGLDVCIAYCESYWTETEPAPDEDSGHFDAMAGFRTVLSRRSFPSVWNTTLVSSMQDRGGVNYTYLDYRRSLDLQRLSGAELESRLQQGYITQEKFQECLHRTDSAFLQSNLQLLGSCLEKVGRLEAFLQANCQPESSDEPTYPDTREFKEELQSIGAVMRQLAGSSESPDESDEVDLDSGAAGPEQGTGAPQKNMDRETALRTIEQLASFFERTEPHSPVHFALRQVVRWGRLPFDKLLIELIDDRSVIENLRRQIGLPDSEKEDK